MIRHEKSMQLSSRYPVRRRFSSTAAALVIVSLLLGSAGAMSVLTADAYRPAPQQEHSLHDADGVRG